MGIEACVLRSKEEGYQVRRYSTTVVLVDEDAPNKGYVKTYVDSPILCKLTRYTNKSKTKTLVSQSNYIFTILPSDDVLNINERDVLLNPDGDELEILFIEAFKVAGVVKSYEAYVR